MGSSRRYEQRIYCGVRRSPSGGARRNARLTKVVRCAVIPVKQQDGGQPLCAQTRDWGAGLACAASRLQRGTRMQSCAIGRGYGDPRHGVLRRSRRPIFAPIRPSTAGSSGTLIRQGITRRSMASPLTAARLTAQIRSSSTEWSTSIPDMALWAPCQATCCSLIQWMGAERIAARQCRRPNPASCLLGRRTADDFDWCSVDDANSAQKSPP
jgi:hypothetical protein